MDYETIRQAFRSLAPDANLSIAYRTAIEGALESASGRGELTATEVLIAALKGLRDRAIEESIATEEACGIDSEAAQIMSRVVGHFGLAYYLLEKMRAG